MVPKPRFRSTEIGPASCGSLTFEGGNPRPGAHPLHPVSAVPAGLPGPRAAAESRAANTLPERLAWGPLAEEGDRRPAPGHPSCWPACSSPRAGRRLPPGCGPGCLGTPCQWLFSPHPPGLRGAAPSGTPALTPNPEVKPQTQRARGTNHPHLPSLRICLRSFLTGS